MVLSNKDILCFKDISEKKRITEISDFCDIHPKIKISLPDPLFRI